MVAVDRRLRYKGQGFSLMCRRPSEHIGSLNWTDILFLYDFNCLVSSCSMTLHISCYNTVDESRIKRERQKEQKKKLKILTKKKIDTSPPLSVHVSPTELETQITQPSKLASSPPLSLLQNVVSLPRWPNDITGGNLGRLTCLCSVNSLLQSSASTMSWFISKRHLFHSRWSSLKCEMNSRWPQS